MKLSGSFFAEHILATTSHMMLFFSFLQISEVCSLKSIYWWSNSKLGEGIPNPIQSCVVREIRWKPHCQVVDLDIPVAEKVEEKEELKNLLKWGKFSYYVMVDRKIVAYLKNKKYLILKVNKKFKIFEF